MNNTCKIYPPIPEEIIKIRQELLKLKENIKP